MSADSGIATPSGIPAVGVDQEVVLVRDAVWEDPGARAREPLQAAVTSFTRAGPARLGGDVWSIASRGDEMLILVADARGSGDDAAPLARALLTVFRTVVRQTPTWDVGRLRQVLDETVRCASTEEDFATALLVRASRDGTLDLLCCGHPPPLALARGGVSEWPCRPSLPLGMGTDVDGIQHGRLRPGERMLLYTDGLTDGVDNLGRFRIEDHADALACADLGVALDALLGRVMQRTGGAVSDDVTAMLLARGADPDPGAAVADASDGGLPGMPFQQRR